MRFECGMVITILTQFWVYGHSYLVRSLINPIFAVCTYTRIHTHYIYYHITSYWSSTLSLFFVPPTLCKYDKNTKHKPVFNIDTRESAETSAWIFDILNYGIYEYWILNTIILHLAIAENRWVKYVLYLKGRVILVSHNYDTTKAL